MRRTFLETRTCCRMHLPVAEAVAFALPLP